MLSFHGDPAIKQKYIDRVQAHADADELIRGIGWKHGKGCAIGCTLEAYDHSRYPIELGIPEWAARLEDVIFEGLPNDQAMTWPRRFLEAVPVGMTEAQWVETFYRQGEKRLAYLAAEQEKDGDEFGVLTAITDVLDLYRRRVEIAASAARAERAESAASAAWAAWAARAESAAWAARAESAASAAWAARAESAASAAWVRESKWLLESIVEASSLPANGND
jgi:hypothetical protein